MNDSLTNETSAGEDGGGDVSTTITDIVMRNLYIVISSLGIVGNALVLIVLFRFTNMRKKVTTLFIINQSILDFMTAVFLLTTTVLPADGRHYDSVSDDIYCRMWVGRVPMWTMIHCSSYNLVALTVERYMSVVHPIVHKMSFSYNKAIAVIVCVWLAGITYDLAGSLSTSNIDGGTCNLFLLPSRAAMLANGVVAFLINYFIPLFVLIFCYSKMAYTLNMKIASLPNHGTSTQQSSLQSRGKKNIIKTLIIVGTAFILCVSWNQIFFLLFNLGLFDYRALSSTFYHFSVVAFFTNCCVNPIIYTAKYEEFKKGLKKIFCRCDAKGKDEISGSTMDTSQHM